MKLCLISNLYPPYVTGGAEITVQKVAENLKSRGNEVLVITTSSGDSYNEVKNGINIYRINPLNVYKTYEHEKKPFYLKPIWHGIDFWNLDTYQTVKNILKEENPDIIHVNNYKGLSLSVFHAAKHFGLPVVFTAHDASLICPRANLLHGNGQICDNPKKSCQFYLGINRKLIQGKVDYLIAPSNFIIDKLKSFRFFEEVKTRKLPWGIKLQKDITRKDYDFIDIAYMGGLSKIKGIQVLIKSFKRLENHNVHLHIFGKGVDEGEFRDLAGSDHRIVFHGYMERDLLIDFYKKSNINVLPSICYDNSPMMIYESFMNSTPVVGSRIGGIPELIEDGYNGYLFEPGNEDELKEILEIIIENPNKLRELEVGAFQSSKKYDLESYVDELETIYLELIGKKAE